MPRQKEGALYFSWKIFPSGYFASNFTLTVNKNNLDVRLYPVILKHILTVWCVSHLVLIYTVKFSSSSHRSLCTQVTGSCLTLVVLQRKVHSLMVGWLLPNWKSELLWSTSCGKHPSSVVRLKALSVNIHLKSNSAPVGTKLFYYKMKGWTQGIFSWIFTDPDDI